MPRCREAVGEEEQGHDQRQVEEDRGRGLRGEAVEALSTAIEGDQRDEGEVGKVIRVRSTAMAKRSGSSAKPGAMARTTHGIASSAATTSTSRAASRKDSASSAKSAPPPAVAGGPAGEQRHEGRTEGTLGEERPEEIGQPQRHERIGDRAGAEEGRGQDSRAKPRTRLRAV
jgi:hypothetical protein